MESTGIERMTSCLQIADALWEASRSPLVEVTPRAVPIARCQPQMAPSVGDGDDGRRWPLEPSGPGLRAAGVVP